jgi:phosphoribosylamine--glycine ligase
VVIEEYLEGPECSMLAFVDSTTIVPMAASQDHKRAHDGDQGPNTGGMGAYSPVPVVSEAEHARMVEIMETTAGQMRAESIDYRGVLYGGFILTSSGPRLLEFNVRFGDPETQVVLPLMVGDLAEIMAAAAENRLADADVAWSPNAAVTVVIASGGYPGAYETGMAIDGLDEAAGVQDVTLYHAGTTRNDAGDVVTAGGRVLDVTAVGPDIRGARDRAYEAVRAISFEGAFHRTDIGLKALAGPAAGCDA